METVGVGTRSAYPSNLPLRSGITRATALAAPVVVGMIFKPAARERRLFFMRQVEDPLVVGVGVDGGHQTAFDGEVIMHDLGSGCQTVGGAGCI